MGRWLALAWTLMALAIACTLPGRPVRVLPEVVGAIVGGTLEADADVLLVVMHRESPSLHARQQELWEPLVSAAEARWDVRFHRISGVLHQPLPAPTLARLCRAVDAENDFTLSALTAMASLSASLIIALAALHEGADAQALWTAAELEEEWQADLWGREAEAEERRARRFAAFGAAMGFAGMVRG